MKNTLQNDAFINFVQDIKQQIISSQYEALKSVNKEYKDILKLQTLSAHI